MARIGCPHNTAPDLAAFIASESSLSLAGVCTHFSGSDLGDKDFTIHQIQCFNSTIALIRKKGINPGRVHAANSGAIIMYSEAYYDMVRPGIIAYGYYPSAEQVRCIPLKPVMELESRIVFLKKVYKGQTISYGMTWTAERDTIIATIPAGYADGYNRLLSSRGIVLSEGKQYPVVGRICMDQCMIDLGPETNVNLYDKVILFGPDPAGPSAEDIARLIGTIPYEVTCNINKRVPRIY